MSDDVLRPYWQQAWQALGMEPPEAPFFNLLQRYSESHRYYHTLQHLEECFSQFSALRHDVNNAAAVLLALWFHDAIYDTRASDNEARSAALAEQVLMEAGVEPGVRTQVSELVLATCHGVAEAAGDTAVLLDIDLAILGARPARFAEYERQVRQEYGWVEPEAYRQGRAAVLQGFISRPRIFSMSSLAASEQQARLNIAGSLRALQGH